MSNNTGFCFPSDCQVSSRSAAAPITYSPEACGSRRGESPSRRTRGPPRDTSGGQPAPAPGPPEETRLCMSAAPPQRPPAKKLQKPLVPGSPGPRPAQLCQPSRPRPALLHQPPSPCPALGRQSPGKPPTRTPGWRREAMPHVLCKIIFQSPSKSTWTNTKSSRRERLPLASGWSLPSRRCHG